MNDFYKALIWLMDNFDSCINMEEDAFWRNVYQYFKGDETVLKMMESIKGTCVDAYGNSDNSGKIKILFNDLCDTRRLVRRMSDENTIENINAILQYMIDINVMISTIVMEYVFEEGNKLDCKDNYHVSGEIIEYLLVLRKDLYVREIERDSLTNHYYSIVHKYDLQFLNEHLSYICLIAVLLLIIEAPFYKKSSKDIAKNMLFELMNLFYDGRISRIIFEPNMRFSEYEKGFHTTTKIEIFLRMINDDRYCLRIDFPHEDNRHIHYNIHEPGRKQGTALPLSKSEYNALRRRYGEKISQLFYESGKRMWFKSGFTKKLANLFSDQVDAMDEMTLLYSRNGHMPIADGKVDSESMKNMLISLTEGLNFLGVRGGVFQKTKLVDIQHELQKMGIQRELRCFAMQLDDAESRENMKRTGKKVVFSKKELMERLEKVYDTFGISESDKERLEMLDDQMFFEELEKIISGES